MVKEAPATKARALPKVLTLPSSAKVLHTKCRRVGEITPAVRALAQTLEDYLGAHRRDEPRLGGIAAPQLGKTIRMFSYIPSDGSDVLTVINPELVYEKKLHYMVEICLSIPKQRFMLKRGKVVKIRGMLVDGSIHSFKGYGVTAQILLHELNHLDGITIDTIGKRVT